MKIETYEKLASCEAIVVVEQERFAARVSVRAEAGWSVETVEGPDAVLAISSAGLSCRLAEIYVRTSLMRGTVAPRRR